MKKFLLISCLAFLLGVTFFPEAEAVDFILRDKKGVYHFSCVNACGPVRVRKAGKCRFFVQSLYYRGYVSACTAEIAALKACGELPFDKPIPDKLLNPACL